MEAELREQRHEVKLQQELLKQKEAHLVSENHLEIGIDSLSLHLFISYLTYSSN